MDIYTYHEDALNRSVSPASAITNSYSFSDGTNVCDMCNVV